MTKKGTEDYCRWGAEGVLQQDKHRYLNTCIYKRASLRTTVAGWLALAISKFPPWPQTRLEITAIFKVLVTVILFHTSYNQGAECSKAVNEWLIIPTVTSHLGQATEFPGTVSAVPTLAMHPSTVKGHLTTSSLHKGQSLMGIPEIVDRPRGGGGHNAPPQ